VRPVFALGLTLLCAGNVGAQSPGTGNREQGTETPRSLGSRFPVPGSQPTEPGSDLTIYLVTMGNGTRIWERFGHNAIRIVDATNRTDSVYNWGTFDFAQPHFLRRFMTGNTLYWMQGDDMPRTLEVYQYTNRSVWAQELDLTPAERLAVRDFIVWNARPEHTAAGACTDASGGHERRHAGGIGQIRERAALEQEPHDVVVEGLRCTQQRGGAGGEEIVPEAVVASAAARLLERELRVHIHTGGQQCFDERQ